MPRDRSAAWIASTVNKDHWEKPLSDPDPAVRQYVVDSVAKSLEETKELGGDTVLVVPGVVSDQVSYKMAYVMRSIQSEKSSRMLKNSV